jgi:hypothetical protein
MTNTPIRLKPLNDEPRVGLPTSEAAAHLNRKPQTLRIWACYDSGPLVPHRINGRLFWPVQDIKRILGGGERST